MLRRLLREESGFSIVEVIMSMVLLSVAIIPMVSMLEVGLKTATTSGNYDTARTLANRQLERAKSLPYATVKSDFPYASAGAAPMTGGTYDNAASPITLTVAPHLVPDGFGYAVRKQFVKLDPVPLTDEINLVDATTDQGLIKVTVTVSWDGGNSSYSTTGVAAR